MFYFYSNDASNLQAYFLIQMEVAEFMQGAQQYLPMFFILSEWRKGLLVLCFLFVCLFFQCLEMLPQKLSEAFHKLVVEVSLIGNIRGSITPA